MIGIRAKASVSGGGCCEEAVAIVYTPQILAQISRPAVCPSLPECLKSGIWYTRNIAVPLATSPDLAGSKAIKDTLAALNGIEIAFC